MEVPTVERGFRVLTFCSIAIAGGIPFMKSHSGLLMRLKIAVHRQKGFQTYRRCPSAYKVSNAKDDFPEPESPVITISLSRGISMSMFLRLFTRAPFTNIELSVILAGQIKINLQRYE